MEERKSFIDKVKQVCEKHTGVIGITYFIAFFIAGYIISWIFFAKPVNDNQLEMCEQVARNVYLQKGKAMFEDLKEFSVDMTATDTTARTTDEIYQCKVIVKLQNGDEHVFSVDMTTTTITVEPVSVLDRGKVIAKLQKGKLIVERDMEIQDEIGKSISIGTMFLLLGMIILCGKRQMKKKQSA